VLTEKKCLRDIRLNMLESKAASRADKLSIKSHNTILQKANLEYKKKEADIMKEKAIAQEELQIAKAKCERKEAELNSALNILKVENEAMKDSDSQMIDNESIINKESFTRDYIERHSHLNPSVPAFEPRSLIQPADNDIITTILNEKRFTAFKVHTV
jgi:hypothetical protein